MLSLLNRLLKRTERVDASGSEIHLNGQVDGCNVLIFTENINATYFIGFDIPLRRLHSMGEVNFAVVSQRHVAAAGRGCWERWNETFQPHVVVMTRYGQPHGVDIFDYFRRNNVPVVYHVDDDLLEVPDTLGTEICKRQGADAVVAARRHLLAHCDLIYASTSYLAHLLRSRFPSQRVFHGIYAPYMGDMFDVMRGKRAYPVIGYMGSKGHQHDLDLTVPGLERLLDERPALHFEVFGTIRMPVALERFRERVRSHPVKKSYVEFLTALGGLGWDLGLAPLVDSSFNRCKAPTKFIEYSACRIPVVASNVAVYAEAIPSGAGLLVDHDWYTAMASLLDDAHGRQQCIVSAQRHCEETYSMALLEQQLKIIFNLVQ